MVIRAQQMASLSDAATRNFELQMCDHLMTFAPVHCGKVGVEVLGHIVRLGVKRAAEYGFENRGAVRFYLELMIQLGTDFDTDPQLGWASPVLAAKWTGTEKERAALLYDRATNYLDAVLGPRYEYEKQALSRASRIEMDELSRVAAAPVDRWLAAMRTLHPQKMDYAGDSAVRAIVSQAAAEASRYALANPAGALLLATLMYAFGHHCASDPQFPWIASTFSGRSGRDPHNLTEYLLVRARGYARESLDALEAR